LKSYIKLYGPPVLKAIKALEKMAIDKPQVCIMDKMLTVADPVGLGSYFGVEIPVERCNTIISKTKEDLGEFDFFFEWFEEPSMAEYEKLVSQIDDALSPLGCRYSIITKK
jgi:hypothetical protein